MTAGGVSTPSPRESAESYTAIQQALVQAESSDWPSQPLSSMQYSEYLSNLHPHGTLAYKIDFSDDDVDPSKLHHDNRDGYAIPAVHNSQNTGMGNQQPQHPLTKTSLLTRPTSSGEDLAAGFSFGKPPPAKVDLTRKKTSDVSGRAPNQGQEHRRQVQIQTQHKSPSRQENAINAAASAGNNVPTQQKSASLKLQGPPFPIGGNKSSSHIGSRPEILAELKDSAPPVQHEASFSADDTLVGSDVHGMNNTFTGDKLADGILTSSYAPDVATIHSHQQNNLVGPSEGRPQQITEAHPRPKVRKTRKKPQSFHSAAGPVNGFKQAAIEEEQLMQQLSNKQRQTANELERTHEALRSKNVELHECIQINNSLYTELQDVSQRYHDTEAHLSQIRASKPGWESKLKKLSDFVKGLSNDHNRLRDDAKVIREGQDSAVKDKDALISTLQAVDQATQRENARSHKAVTEARHDIKTFEQTIQHQQIKLQEDEALLLSERQRNKHLEEQISTFATSHEQLQGLFAGHREAITEKINDLLMRSSAQVQATAPVSSQDDLRPMIEQCVKLLKALTKSDGGVKTADLHELEKTMHKYFEGITRSVEACDHNTSMMESGHQQLALSVQNELQALSSNIVTEHTLSEQINDLREMRATVRERLHSTEILLRDAKQEVLTLQNEKKDHVRRIIMLENDRGNRQPAAVDPHILLRLQETDTNNKELRKEQATLSAEVSSLVDQLRQKDEDFHQLQAQWTESQALTEKLRDQASLIEQEKLKLEEQVVVEREQMREHFSHTASREKEKLRVNYQSAMRKLQATQPLSDQKCKEAEAENKRLEKERTTLQARLDALQNERQSEATQANRLRQRVAELENQAEERDGQYETLHQQLLGEKEDNRAKDGYIQAILADNKKLLADNNKLREADAGTSVRPSDLIKKPSHQSALVEDSQPSGQFRFASQSDLMGLGEQGFEPDEMLDPDLSGLFPGTPKQSHTVEVTNLSYSRSRISSRDGAGSPAAPKARHSQQQAVSRPTQPGNKSSTSQRRPRSENAQNHSESAFTPTKAIQQQHNSHENTQAPRGILKQTAQDPRGRKRTAVDTDPASVSGFTTSKRRRPSGPTNGLGPIIGDSQSPMKGINGRARKQTTRHGVKNKRDEHMLETFRGYTNNNQAGSQ